MIEVQYPASWATVNTGAQAVEASKDKYFQNFIRPIIAQEGDKLPVSAFNADGTVPTATTRFEKRGIAAAPCMPQLEPFKKYTIPGGGSREKFGSSPVQFPRKRI